jgi:dolichol-phosphate mannosyltransferase
VKIVIIVPTYNERDNISQLVPAIFAKFVARDHEPHILIVDDSSPDGTGDVVRDLQRRLPERSSAVGCNAGLGAAYIAA